MKKNMIKKNCYSTIFDSVFGLDWAASYVPSTDMDTFLVSADTAVLILEGLSGLASSILISSRLSVPAPLPQMPASLLLTVNLIIHYREIKHVVIKLPLHLSLNYQFLWRENCQFINRSHDLTSKNSNGNMLG